MTRCARSIRKLIYCSITGYGQTGPRAGEAGHDLNYIGHTGLLALNPGPLDRPVVPPALIADIAGGTFPAVMNMLLALRQRDRSGQGCHLDIAMTDAMFTFAGHALASGHATGQFPGMGGARLTGGSPRYQLYPTRTASSSAARRWSRNSGRRSRRRSGSRRFVDDRRDPAATRAAVAEIIAGRTAEEWRPVFAAADCCVTIMATLQEALHDPHFVERGLFAHQVAGPTGATMPALPVPIDPQFRDDAGDGQSGAEAQRVNEGEMDAEHQHSGEEQEAEHLGMDELADVLAEEHADEGDRHGDERARGVGRVQRAVAEQHECQREGRDRE